MRTAFLLPLLLVAAVIQAQDSTAPPTDTTTQETEVYKVNPGELVSEALLKNGGLYQYPKFMEALVLFKNGNSGNGLLNYNRLSGEMQFIDSRGDTLALNNEPEIDKIAIGKDTFYYFQGFLQKVEEFSAVLAKQTYLGMSNREKLGLYGNVSQNAVNTPTSVETYQGFKDIIPQEILTFRVQTIYFIGDKFGYFKPLNKKNVLYLYSKRERTVSDYLRNNPVNFNKEEDVMRLVGFLKTL